MKWLVCGGRDFGNIPNMKNFVTLEYIDQKKREYRFVFDKLEELARQRLIGYPSDEMQLPFGIEIISGMAKGVDSVAVDWAICNFLPLHEFPADWDKLGKAAGFIRNKQMLDEGKPDLVVSFPGGRGTKMMVELARKAGVEVIEFELS